MEQEQRLDLMWGITNAPEAAPTSVIVQLKTLKQAVRLGWATRRIKGMTQSHLAAICGFYAPHVSQWLSDKEGMPDIPAKHIPRFCEAIGNLIPMQFLNAQANLTVMEEVQANLQSQRRAA